MSTTGKPNILLIIADDLGADSVLITDRSPERKMYVMTDAGGPMILGALDILSIFLRCGLSFEQAWAHPVCSPTRGSIYSGTWPGFNGVGYPNAPQLDPAQPGIDALPELLNPEGYACGIFGKWHLGEVAGYRPPNHGWVKHVGTLGGVLPSYFSWPKVDSDTGYVVNVSSVYATRDAVEEAGAWIRSILIPDNETPWFATLAFNTAHDPFETPPFGYQLPGGALPASPQDNYNAMVQNMNANIGRLLGSGAGPAIDFIREPQLKNTVIIFIGDNGSPSQIATEEPKDTIYEGGVRVPMIIADGQSVTAAMNGNVDVPRFLAPEKLNRASKKLVHAIDLYATIAEIAGVAAALPMDTKSVSLWSFSSLAGNQPPTREFNFSQYFKSTDQGVTIRNSTYKLNCERQSAGGGIWTWSLYEYWDGEVPGLEGSSAEDIFPAALADVQAGVLNDAADNLNALLDELILSGNYTIDHSGTAWVDPR